MRRGTARGGQASLRLRTDVGLLASVYPQRAGVPFSFYVSLSHSSTCSALFPTIYLSFLLVPHSYMYVLSLSFPNVPPSTPPPPSSTLTFHLPAARSCLTSLPLYYLLFPSNCSPVQPRISPSISQHSSRPSRFVRCLLRIFYPSSPASPSPRLAPFLSHFRPLRRFLAPFFAVVPSFLLPPSIQLGLHSCFSGSLFISVKRSILGREFVFVQTQI